MVEDGADRVRIDRKRQLYALTHGKAGRLVIAHKDRLLRFGAELLFARRAAKGGAVVIRNEGEDASFEEDVASDVLDMITVVSARLCGARSHRNQTLPDGVRRAVDAVAPC